MFALFLPVSALLLQICYDGNNRPLHILSPQQLFQRGAVRVAGFAPALPHAVRVIRERLTVPVVANVVRQLVQRVVGLDVRQLAVALAG